MTWSFYSDYQGLTRQGGVRGACSLCRQDIPDNFLDNSQVSLELQQGVAGHGSPAPSDSPGVRLVTSPDDSMVGYLEDTPPKLVFTNSLVLLVLTFCFTSGDRL